MPTAPRVRTPQLRRHKVKGKPGRAFVELNGHRHYLGQWGTDDARSRYDRIIAEWLSNGRRPVTSPDAPVTIVELLAAYWRHAQQHYRKPDGTPTSRLTNIKPTVRLLKALYGTTPAADFRPRQLKAVRQAMIERGWCRSTVNDRIGIIRQMFRWAVAEGMVQAMVHQALAALAGLRAGRSDAPEREPIRPVPDAHVEAIKPHVSRQVWSMIDVQRLTGARPGEIVGLRPMDIDRTGEIWTAELHDHKTAWRGKGRTIFIGPKGQQIIAGFLDRAPHNPLFSPTEAEAERRTKLAEQRITPLSCGNVPGSNRKAKPQREPGEQYDTNTYRQAVERACKAADVEVWTPNRLRHNAARDLHHRYGIDVAGAVLGHALGSTITAVYTEQHVAAARRAVAEIG